MRGDRRAASPRGWRRACGWTPCRRGRPRRAASSILSRLAAPCGAATVGTVDRRRTPRQARDAPGRVAATAAQRDRAAVTSPTLPSPGTDMRHIAPLIAPYDAAGLVWGP